MFNRVLNFNKTNLANGMPNMANTLNGWEVTLTLIKIKQTIINGDLTPIENRYDFLGVIQPMQTEQLLAKPEGQRSWNYYWVHTKSDLPFQTADKIIFKNTKYKITGVKDYSLNGFKELEVILDYQ